MLSISLYAVDSLFQWRLALSSLLKTFKRFGVSEPENISFHPPRVGMLYSASRLLAPFRLSMKRKHSLQNVPALIMCRPFNLFRPPHHPNHFIQPLNHLQYLLILRPSHQLCSSVQDHCIAVNYSRSTTTSLPCSSLDGPFPLTQSKIFILQMR